MEEYPLITILAAGFTLSYILGMIAIRFKLPPIIGYLVSGLLIGPYTPGLVVDLKLAQEVSGMGVILLMFGVGLQFSFKDISNVKYIALPGAILQIILSISICILASYYLLGFNLLASIIFGFTVSTPSTVVALKTLEDNKLTNTRRGQITIGWLVMGDIAMILAIIIIPSLAVLQTTDTNSSINFKELTYSFLKVGLNLVAFVLIMIFVGRKLIPFIIRRASAKNNQEIFTIAIMTIALGIAYFSTKIFGISFALGAFFAGLIVNESEFAERVKIETLPWRDAFSVLFFVSVGMLFDFKIILQEPAQVIFVLLMVMVFNVLITFILLRILGKNKMISATIAAIVAQVGEFSFVVSTLGVTFGFINIVQNNVIIAAAIITIILNPFIVKATVRAVRKTEFTNNEFENINKSSTQSYASEAHLPSKEIENSEFNDETIKSRQFTCLDHTIIIGDNQLATTIQSALTKLHLSSIHIVTKDKEIPTELINCEYSSTVVGEFTEEKVYNLANIKAAKVIFFVTDNIYSIETIAQKFRQEFPDLKIVIVTRYRDEYKHFIQLGFDHVYSVGIELGMDIIARGNLLNISQQNLETVHKEMIDDLLPSAK